MTGPSPEPTDPGSEPLRPHAAVEEIEARVRYLSHETVGPEEPAGITAPGLAGPGPHRRGRLALVGTGGVAVLAWVLLKVVLPLTVVTAVSGVLSSVFGGSFERLPADQRQQLETRFKAAVGDTLKGLSDADASSKVESLVNGGLPRLDDAMLIDRVTIWSQGIAAVDTATCATAARAEKTIDAKLVEKILGALDTAKIGRWYDIQVAAVEAASRSSPEPRVLTAASSDALFTTLVAGLSKQDFSVLQAMSGGTAETDADACAAVRHLYATGVALDPADRAAFALSDVTP